MNVNFGPSFIEVYDKVLSSDECELLISQFEKSPQKEGIVLKHGVPHVEYEHKKSLEMGGGLTYFSKATVTSSIISTSLNKCLDKYKEKYSFFNNYVGEIKYADEYTFKKFEGEDAGYKMWHHEHGSGDLASKRVLVWAFYLNDAPGTDFMFYPSLLAKKGRCVIFPASFNYMHKSSPNKGIKYIITGWFSYT